MPGEHFAWREALVDGPTPANVSTDEWRRVRVEHLCEAYGLDRRECESELEAGEHKFASYGQHDEVALWFEHDLFCQVHLIYLLAWFRKRDLGKTKLSLVCIGEFPGKERFRGLGDLNPEELESLFPARRRITEEQFATAELGWRAYCSRDPTDVQSLLSRDTSVLPFLRAAMKAHLQRFPSKFNGLGRVENITLRAVDDGATIFKEVFTRFGEVEPIYGFGDVQIWLSLRHMIAVGQPLLRMTGADPASDVEPDAGLEITELGKAVLNGEADFITLNGIDRWLGGVYLEDERNIWRWDEKSEKLTFG